MLKRPLAYVNGLVPLGVWERLENHAKWQRLHGRVGGDVVAQVKAQKATGAALRATYTHEPRLAAVVTSFNQLWNVTALADGLLGHPDIDEVVVCEDGSVDGSLAAWDERLIGPNHFLVRSNDLHEIRALDRAFRLSRAAIVCIVQDDDVVPADDAWASDVLRLFDAHPRLGIVGGFQAYLEAPGETQGSAEPDLSFIRSLTSAAGPFRFVPTVSIGPYYVRKAFYEEVGGFDTAYSAPGQAGVGFDEELALRAWLQGWHVGYLHQPFKTGEVGQYDYGAGGTFLYGDASERTTHDIENKRHIARTYGPHHDFIMRAVQAANEGLA